jgi:hypothetical protein
LLDEHVYPTTQSAADEQSVRQLPFDVQLYGLQSVWPPPGIFSVCFPSQVACDTQAPDLQVLPLAQSVSEEQVVKHAPVEH